MSVYVNVSIPGTSAGVAGPFSGQGQFQLMAAGIHTYATQQDAQNAAPQTLTSAQAQVFLQVSLEGPGIGQGFFGLAHDAAAAPGAAVSAVSSALNPFGFLSQASFWVRAGEVAAGLILLGIGLNAMLKGKPLQIVTRPAGALGKVVP